VSEFFFWRLRKTFGDFFIAILHSPCYETPENAIKKWSKTTEGEEKKRRKISRIFCDEPRWAFLKKKHVVFFNSPCYEMPKNAIKKSRLKKIERVGAFFFAPRQMYVTFINLFYAPLWPRFVAIRCRHGGAPLAPLLFLLYSADKHRD
jgi:hypothetical protein